MSGLTARERNKSFISEGDYLNPRLTAYRMLNKIMVHRGYANIVLDHTFRKGNRDPRDKSLITELVYGVIRQKRYLDWVLDRFLLKKKEVLPLELQNIFRLGIYQALFLKSIPDYAIVNEMVELAKISGFGTRKNFINAVLRNIIRQKNKSIIKISGDHSREKIGIKYSHPDWIIDIFLTRFGLEKTLQLCEFNNQPGPVVLRINTLKIKTRDYLKWLEKDQIKTAQSFCLSDSIMIKSPVTVEKLPGYKDGLFHIQDESTQLVCHLVSPRPGDLIMDFCAAPGGKSILMAELMGNKGKIIAIDINPSRVKLIDQAAKRLGVNIIETYPANAENKLSMGIPKWADKILVDAPCTGLGILRRKVDARWNKQEKDIARLTQIQSRLLDNAVRYLKPGGILIYSTCTLTGQENENMIQSFLARYPEFEIEPASNYLPVGAKQMVTPDGFLFTLPSRDGMDGMFACRMRRGKI